MRLSSKVLIAVILGTLLLLAFNGWRESLREEGRQEVREQVRQQAEADAQRMRDLQRQSELRYTVAAETRDRFIVTTVKEIRDASAPLAACPVPEPVRVQLNAAAGCARGDSPAACGPGEPMPLAR